VRVSIQGKTPCSLRVKRARSSDREDPSDRG
jgi:hypothetical protein